MQRASIAASCIPSQEHTRQNFPAPRQFGPTDWMFSIDRQLRNDWNGKDEIYGSDNYFPKNEGYQNIKNGMFGPLPTTRVFGHVDYSLNPLDNEQTNSHTSAYRLQGQTRVDFNMNPSNVMRYPAFAYPTTSRINEWVNHYVGSARTR